MNRELTTGDVVALTGVAVNTLDRWITAGFLGTDKADRNGRGCHRTFTAMEALAVAAGVSWRDCGADADRVSGVVRLIAGWQLERLEAEFEAGRTFPVPNVMLNGFELPGTGGIFVEPQKGGTAAKLMADLDLAKLWTKVKADIAKLPAPRVRGRKKAKRA